MPSLASFLVLWGSQYFAQGSINVINLVDITLFFQPKGHLVYPIVPTHSAASAQFVGKFLHLIKVDRIESPLLYQLPIVVTEGVFTKDVESHALIPF